MVAKAMWSLRNFSQENVFRACDNIGQPRPAAQRGRHREVSNEKQRTNHGEQLVPAIARRNKLLRHQGKYRQMTA